MSGCVVETANFLSVSPLLSFLMIKALIQLAPTFPILPYRTWWPWDNALADRTEWECITISFKGTKLGTESGHTCSSDQVSLLVQDAIFTYAVPYFDRCLLSV